MNCNKCGNEPQETDRIAWKCTSCGKAYGVKLSYLQKIQEKKNSNGVANLLKCKECGKPLDNGDEKIFWKCSCGNVQSGRLGEYGEKINNIIESNLMKCPDCGHEVSKKAEKCPNCGCPIKFDSDKKRFKKGNKKKIIMLIVIILVLIAISMFIGFSIHRNNEKRKAKLYKDNLSEVATMINKSSSSVEFCGRLIYNVWNNAIQEKFNDVTDKYTVKNPKPREGSSFEEVWDWLDKEHFYDYNTALQNLFSAEEFINETDKIYTEQNKIKGRMKELKNPPTQFKEEYEAVKNYYEIYLSFATMVTNVNGSLQTWSSNYNNTETDLLNGYKKVQTYIDNEK